MSGDTPSDVEARARAWYRARHSAVCDRIEPWAHGSIVRASRFPDYFEFNLVRVEGDPGLSARELMELADDALAELPHRRIDFEPIEPADRVRADFEAAGWEVTRLLWLRHEAPLPPGPDVSVEAVAYDEVTDLRVRWNREDFPDLDTTAFQIQARELALAQDVEVLAVRERGEPVAFAQLQRDRTTAEVTHVYVHPDHRGNLMGTALTRAAVGAAGSVEDLWIVADDEDRPKELYARLGFRPAWTSMELTRLPS